MSQHLKTIEEWNNMGYRVIYGEHSEHRNKFGAPLFRPDQVEEDYREYDEEAEYEEAHFWTDVDPTLDPWYESD